MEVQEKDPSFIISVLCVIFLLWQFCILFGLWGGYPEGAFVKIKRLEIQIEKLQVQSKQPIPEHKKWHLSNGL